MKVHVVVIEESANFVSALSYRKQLCFSTHSLDALRGMITTVHAVNGPKQPLKMHR